MLWEHPLCRGCIRQRSYRRIVQLLTRVQAGLAALDPAAFLMVDAPSGYGYRRLSLATFDPDWREDDPDDDAGVTIPWPPGEVHTVARVFHLAGLEALSLVAIAQACGITTGQVRAILANPFYTRLGVLDEVRDTGQLQRLTVIPPALFALCHAQHHVVSWGVPTLTRQTQAAQRHERRGTGVTGGPAPVTPSTPDRSGVR